MLNKTTPQKTLQELRGETVRFTVVTKDQRVGVLIFQNFNGEQIIGRIFPNIKFRVGLDSESYSYTGMVTKIQKVDFFNNWRWKRVNLKKD